MISEDQIKKYYLNKEELKKLGDFADMDCVFDNDEEIEEDDIPLPINVDNPKTEEIIKTISRMAISEDPDVFCSFMWDARDLIASHVKIDHDLKEVIELAYRYLISQGSGQCANDLGAMYYSGFIFEQDYVKAKDLYEMAVDMGSDQALINLGYIYEYGRVGKPDYKRAFEIYARSAALLNNFESLYKLGDMYSSGKVTEKNMRAATSLWMKSYDVSESKAQKCHAAFRIAKILMAEDADECGLEYDPLLALGLFQEAECGFRLEIKNGATYYNKSLREAIEWQKKARDVLDFSIE